MRHRGPDSEGVYCDQAGDRVSVGLGSDRLAIFDPTPRAAQPMTSSDRRYVLVLNGAIYNYREIAAELDWEAQHEGSGDTAVALQALIRWGPDALGKFNGMWALVFYDSVEKTLLVSRDRLGIKPLYWFHDGQRTFFASEIKGILAATDDRFAIDPDVAIPYLTRGLIDFSERTLFSGVHRFPAASYAVMHLGCGSSHSPQPTRFWLHPFERGETPQVGAVSAQEIRERFVDAVGLHLRSDVPIGVLLSGGLDSSAIVGAAASLGMLSRLSVISVISDDAATNEEKFVDMMATHFNFSPHKVNVSRHAVSMLDHLSDACWYNDGPPSGISDIARLPALELTRSLGIKVLVNGQGADEQLGGYNKFFYFWLQSLLAQRSYAAAAATVVRFALHSNTLREFELSEAMRYIGRRRLSSATFIRPDHQRRDDVDLGLQGSYPRREWIDLVSTSLPALLHIEDRMSMSRSLELRVPFLDYRLVECLARVHPSEKFAGGRTKSIFRTAVEGLVPKEIRLRRDKNGFALPEDEWMRGAFTARVREIFRSDMRAESLGFLDAERLRTSYDRFVRGHGYLNGRQFFRAMAFELFLRRFEPHIEATPMATGCNPHAPASHSRRTPRPDIQRAAAVSDLTAR